MALSREQSLALYGTERYTAWGEAEAQADAASKGLKPGAGNSVPGPFNFNFEEEAKKAYGELGTYYTRLITEYKGDLNKIFSRLMEDYDRGVRDTRADAGVAKADLALQDQAAKRSTQASALSRGLYQKSLFGPPSGGYGIPDTELAQKTELIDRARQKVDTGVSRYEELYGVGGVQRTRAAQDQTQQAARREFELEQQRREQAAGMANTRGSQAYQNTYYKNLYNPTLV